MSGPKDAATSASTFSTAAETYPTPPLSPANDHTPRRPLHHIKRLDRQRGSFFEVGSGPKRQNGWMLWSWDIEMPGPGEKEAGPGVVGLAAQDSAAGVVGCIVRRRRIILGSTCGRGSGKGQQA